MPKTREASVADALRALRRKLWLKRVVHFATWGLMVGIGAALFELIVARVLPIWHPWRWAFGFVLIGLATGVMIGLLRRVSIVAAARFADRNGLMERMVTALAYERDLSPAAVLQREEALDRYRREEERLLRRVTVWSVPRWMAACLTCCVLLGGLLWWLPNPMQEVVKEQQQVQQALEKERQKVAEAEKSIADDDQLTPEQKEMFQQELEKLEEQLADSENLEEGLKALAEAEAELNRLAKEADNRRQALDGLRGQLASHPVTGALAEALSERDEVKLREAMQEARDALEQLSPDEREALAGMLAQAANELDDQDLTHEELVQTLQEAANSIGSGDTEQAAIALESAVGEAIAASRSALAAANAADQTAQLLTKSKQALAQAGQSGTATARGNGATDGQISGNEHHTGARNGSPGTNGRGNGSSGDENGNSHGIGNGNNSRNGNGARSGSGSGNVFGNGGGAGGSGAGTGSGAGLGSGSRELVSVPSERLNGGGPEETVGGPLGDGAETEKSRGSSIGSPGVSRPYTDVFGQYEQAAREALERSDLPRQYQQLVKDYFADIEPSHQ